MSGSMFMTWWWWVGAVAASTPGGSTPPRSCSGRGAGGRGRHGAGGRFGVSVRQARRYVGAGRGAGRVEVPRGERGVHRQAAGGAGRAGAGARAEHGATISAVVAAGVGRVPGAGPRRAVRAGERAGRWRRELVFDRHAAAELSVAYAHSGATAAGPHRRAGQEGGPPHDQRGDLRPGVLGPAEEGRDDRLADRGAARARRAAGA